MLKLYIGQRVTLAGHTGEVTALAGQTVTLRTAGGEVRVTVTPAPRKRARPKGATGGK